MLSISTVITILTVCAVSFQLLKHWVFSKGNLWLGYRLNVVIFSCYLILETILAFNAPGQLTLLFMNIVNVWALTMAIRGILRLEKEEKAARQKHKQLIPVIIESPYRATETVSFEEHEAYAKRCMKDSLSKGEAPFASHLLYTQSGVLNDLIDEERELGIDAGFSWRKPAAKTIFYMDYGMSPGMIIGLEHAKLAGHEIEYRTIGKN